MAPCPRVLGRLLVVIIVGSTLWFAALWVTSGISSVGRHDDVSTGRRQKVFVYANVYTTTRSTTLPLKRCSQESEVGFVDIAVKDAPKLQMFQIAERNPSVKHGGEWSPNNCMPQQRVAIIVPFRDRWDHLVRLLDALHPMLQRQLLHYKIFVVEQAGTELFNKGTIMNTAFKVASEEFRMDCVLFHDVDLLPLDDRNFYGCDDGARHLPMIVDKSGHKLHFTDSRLAGGVLNMRPGNFRKINGYSNTYWGWGGEDDDMFYRLKQQRVRLRRPPKDIAKYKMMKHSSRETEDRGLEERKKHFESQAITDMSQNDGLSTLKSKVLGVHGYDLFTHIMVDVGDVDMSNLAYKKA